MKAIKYNAEFSDGDKKCKAKITKYGNGHNPFYEVLTGKHKGSLVHLFNISKKTVL